jgi:hypothetical protein
MQSAGTEVGRSVNVIKVNEKYGSNSTAFQTFVAGDENSCHCVNQRSPPSEQPRSIIADTTESGLPPSHPPHAHSFHEAAIEANNYARFIGQTIMRGQ